MKPSVMPKQMAKMMKNFILSQRSTNDWYQIVHPSSFYWIAHTSHLLVNIKGNTCTHVSMINDVMIISSKSGLTRLPSYFTCQCIFNSSYLLSNMSLAQGKCLQNINQLIVYFSHHQWCKDHIKSKLLCILKGRNEKWIDQATLSD